MKWSMKMGSNVMRSKVGLMGCKVMGVKYDRVKNL